MAKSRGAKSVSFGMSVFFSLWGTCGEVVLGLCSLPRARFDITVPAFTRARQVSTSRRQGLSRSCDCASLAGTVRDKEWMLWARTAARDTRRSMRRIRLQKQCNWETPKKTRNEQSMVGTRSSAQSTHGKLESCVNCALEQVFALRRTLFDRSRFLEWKKLSGGSWFPQLTGILQNSSAARYKHVLAAEPWPREGWRERWLGLLARQLSVCLHDFVWNNVCSEQQRWRRWRTASVSWNRPLSSSALQGWTQSSTCKPSRPSCRR